MTAVPDGVELATGYVTIVPDGSKIGPELKRQFGVADTEADRAGRTSGKKFGSAFGAGLKLIGGAAIGAGLVKGFNASVDAASDLSETVNKSTVIFGKNGVAIEKWADGADRSLGLSKQAALESAAGFGDMFDQIGFTGDQAAKLSKKVVQMSADLGSFNNLGTDEVADRISAAFRGEYDSLQALIPNINAARVESVALGQTHKKTAKELTAAEKATAVLAIVQKDGARAAGDFARTSDGLANSQKIQAAEVENLKAKIGSGLLPIQLKVTRFLSDNAVPAISDFVDGMKDGTGAGGEFADAAREIGDGLKDVCEFGMGVIEFFDDLPGGVKKTAFQLGIALVVLGKFRAVTGPALTSMTGFATGLRNVETRAAATARGMTALKGGLTNAAGAGGMLLLADSTNETSRELGVLKGAAGGALTGAALGAFGGPVGAGIGAGIGAIAGGVLSLATNAGKSGKAAEEAQPPLERYMSTIEDGADAVARYNRETAVKNLNDSGAIEAGRKLGLASKTVVNAALGNAAAQRKVDSALDKARRNYMGTIPIIDAFGKVTFQTGVANTDLATAAGTLTTALGVNQKAYKADVIAANDAALAAGNYDTVLSGINPKVQTRIDQLGVEKARENIVDLTRKYNLTPKQVETVMRAAGEKPTKAAIDRVIDRANALDGKTATVGIGVLLSGTGNALLDGLGLNKRALGGPVTAGQPYIVGENRPELFVPNESGRILPRVPGGGVASAPVSLAGQRLALLIAGQQIEGVIVDLADTRVGAQKGVDAMIERSFG